MKYYHPRFLFRRYEIIRQVRTGNSFLEIGPGNLGLAQELLAKFKQGTLIDFNTTDVQQIYDGLKEVYRQRLKLVIADFSQNHPFDNVRFDCVLACDVLEHIEDDKAFLRRTNELLVDCGQLIISVPARKKYWSVDDDVVGHYRRYEKQELFTKLVEAGYSQIVIISYGFPFTNLVRLARIALVRLQYKEKANWDQRKQSQQSAFIVKRNPYINLIGLVLNKYTMYPLSLFASLFNNFDLAEGYIITARKGAV